MGQLLTVTEGPSCQPLDPQMLEAKRWLLCMMALLTRAPVAAPESCFICGDSHKQFRCVLYVVHRHTHVYMSMYIVCRAHNTKNEPSCELWTQLTIVSQHRLTSFNK